MWHPVGLMASGADIKNGALSHSKEGLAPSVSVFTFQHFVRDFFFFGLLSLNICEVFGTFPGCGYAGRGHVIVTSETSRGTFSSRYHVLDYNGLSCSPSACFP